MARNLLFWIEEVEELYFICNESKGTDQLRSYCATDLRLCFRICKKQLVSRCGSYLFLQCLYSLLQEEKVEHAETRIRLSEMTDKLEIAMSRIEQLSKQLEQEKKTHEKAYVYYILIMT